MQAADKAHRFKGSGTDIREIVEAQSNLEDVSNMIRTAHRNREPFFHTAVYIELIARTEQEFSELQDSVEAELGRGKISADRMSLCQQDGFLSMMPSGHNAFGEEFERMLPASSIANFFPFAYTGKTYPNGFYIGYDKYSSSIIVDLERRAADKSNGNTLILGSSGKGKSYFLKLLLSYKPFDNGQIETIEIMLGRLYRRWNITDAIDLAGLGPKDFPTLSDLYDLMDAEYQRFKTEGEKEELYTPELLRSALLGLHSICKGADSKFFSGHTNIDASRFITFGVKDLMESGKNIKDAMRATRS